MNELSIRRWLISDFGSRALFGLQHSEIAPPAALSSRGF
jgi:hypothetical protein